jgi:hypothetical protein
MLSHALQTAVEMRDKFVVLQLEPGALLEPKWIETLATSLALLRRLDLRLIIVADEEAGGGLQAALPGSAVRLQAAIGRQGQRAILLSAASLISVQKLMIAAPAAQNPDGTLQWTGTPNLVPKYIPVVDQVILSQLCSLRYIPILLLPLVDTAGERVDLPASEVLAEVGKFMDASLLVFVRPPGASAPPVVAGGRRTIVTSAETQEGLFAEIFGKTKEGASA